MKKLPLLLLSLCMVAFSLQAQELAPCGTKMSQEQKEWLRAYQANPIEYRDDEEQIDYVPILFHIVGTDEGTGFYPVTEVFRVLCELNDDFSDSGMQFFIYEDFNYIYNTDFYVHDFWDGGTMMNLNNEYEAVNVYIVDDPAGNCGYFSPGNNGVALAKSCSGEGSSTFAHELGHFFGLPHTFFGWEDAYEYDNNSNSFALTGGPSSSQWEKVDGSNCSFTGDGFCDTPPDYISYRWGCPYSSVLEDPNGETFTPDHTYYMSYSRDGCATRFSPEQQGAMIANLYSQRSELLGWPEMNTAPIGETTVFHPTNASENVPVDEVLITWKTAANADEYYLQVLQYNVSGGTDIETYVTDTFYIATDLEPNVDYFIRIQALSNGNTCTERVNTFFKTGSQEGIYLSSLSMETPSCNGEEDGVFTIEVSGGEEPYEYEWEDGNTTTTVSNADAGMHVVTVTDNAGNTNEINVFVPDPLVLEVEAVQESVDLATATISGGSLPFTYEWSNGETTPTATSLENGPNSLQVTDANGCTATYNFTMIGLNINVSDISCNGEEDGLIALTASGGEEPYEYEWSNGASTGLLQNLPPGAYTVTITDANDGRIVQSFNLEEPSELAATVDVELSSATATVNGGVPPYTYAWPTGTTLSNSVTGLPNIAFPLEVLITDSRGCSIAVSFEITDSNVGIEDLDVNSLNVYPNVLINEPTLNVQYFLGKTSQVTLSIYNSTGQLLQQQTQAPQAGNQALQVPVQNLNAGLYLLQLTIDGESISRKFMVAK